MGIPFGEIGVNRVLARLYGFIVAVVHNRAGQPANNGFDNVEKLRRGRQRGEFDFRAALFVDRFDMFF